MRMNLNQLRELIRLLICMCSHLGNPVEILAGYSVNETDSVGSLDAQATSSYLGIRKQEVCLCVTVIVTER